jgi:hypothetical protein
MKIVIGIVVGAVATVIVGGCIIVQFILDCFSDIS